MTTQYIPENEREKRFAAAFLKFDGLQDVLNFLRDILTPAEIAEFSRRLEIARLLHVGGKSYMEIAKEVGTSTTTVTRVAQWLKNGCGGYEKALK